MVEHLELDPLLVPPPLEFAPPLVRPLSLELPPPGPGCDGASAPEPDVPGRLEYLPDQGQVLKIRHRMHSSHK